MVLRKVAVGVFTFLTIGLGAILCILPLTFLGWIVVEPRIVELNFHVYPQAQQVSRAYGSYGADSGLRWFAYWTPDSLDEVKAYYATFCYPFIGNQTIFHPYGRVLQAYQVDGTTPIDFTERRTCNYTQVHQCIQIELIEFSQAQQVELPPFRGLSNLETPTPLTTELRGGTLILYGYYTNDF